MIKQLITIGIRKKMMSKNSIVILILVYFIINFHLEDYKIYDVSFFSIVALLSTLFLFLLYVADFYINIKNKMIIIIKFLLLSVIVFFFHKWFSIYFTKFLQFSFIINFPIFFMIRDFIEYQNKTNTNTNSLEG